MVLGIKKKGILLNINGWQATNSMHVLNIFVEKHKIVCISLYWYFCLTFDTFVLHNLCQTILHSTELKNHTISMVTIFFCIATVFDRTYQMLIFNKILEHKNAGHRE